MFVDPNKDLDDLENALRVAGVAWWSLELPSGVIFFSPNKTEMLGHRPKKFVHYQKFLDLARKKDQPKIIRAMEEHLAGEKPVYEITYRLKCKNGGYKTFYDRGKVVYRKGDDIKIAGITINVTQMKKSITES